MACTGMFLEGISHGKELIRLTDLEIIVLAFLKIFADKQLNTEGKSRFFFLDKIENIVGDKEKVLMID